jgi:hypothetical protein
VDRGDILGNPPTNPQSNAQFSHWEIPIQTWWAQNSFKYPIITSANKPTMQDDVHTTGKQPKVSIIEPSPLINYLATQNISLKISSQGPYPLKRMDVFINDTFIETLEAPFTFYFSPKDLDNLKTKNEIKIISYDSVENRGETTSTFSVVY